MASSPKDKFEAAVKVIRGLPKNGSFQPSHELMLKFYSYYKQATEGPCTAAKPGFWDLVNRKKWEAWSNLGDMESETAMLMYVDELKKVSIDVRKTYYPPQIVETMPQTNAVTEFLQKLDNFYEMVEDSENQNTLKLLDKPWPNGAPEDNEDETLTHSYNVNELLKQDLKKWQDSSFITNGDSKPQINGIGSSNGHESLPHQNGGSRSETESDETDLGAEEEEDSQEEVNSDLIQNGGWEEFKEEKIFLESVNDSETESEEFCDTSDEPLEAAVPSFAHLCASQLSSVSEFSSTPIPKARVVHFDPSIGHSGSDHALNDSLIVNVTAKTGDLSSLETQADSDSVLRSKLNGSFEENCDVSMCRGGDSDERRHKSEGSEARGYSSTGGGRGRHLGSGDGGQSGHGNPGAGSGGGRRGLFPNPGGGGGNRGSDPGGKPQPVDLNEQIVVTLLRLQHDMSGVLKRLNSLEELVRAEKMARDKKDKLSKGWWPVPDLSPKTALLIIVWPFVAHFLLKYFSQKHRRS
ncbi:acyl-CoA-binding domain-containing protein 5 [Biomphalaria glabrata]|nr:acyl-CoA-binding domain-containing protein 5 [Biomphalaria glabrata]